MILILGLCFSQNNVTFLMSDDLEVIDSLNKILENKKDLTGSYELDSYNHINDKIHYQYHNEKKMVDTVIV